MIENTLTADEIIFARAYTPEPDAELTRRLMAKWEGKCWLESQVLYGILIGLRIAENRSKPKGANQ